MHLFPSLVHGPPQPNKQKKKHKQKYQKNLFLNATSKRRNLVKKKRSVIIRKKDIYFGALFSSMNCYSPYFSTSWKNNNTSTKNRAETKKQI